MSTQHDSALIAEAFATRALLAMSTERDGAVRAWHFMRAAQLYALAEDHRVRCAVPDRAVV